MALWPTEDQALQPTDPRNSANQINQPCQQEPGNHTKGEGDAKQHPPTTNQRREPKLNLPVSGRENQTVPACTLIGHENRDPDQSVLEPKLANTRIGDPTLIHPFAFKQIVTSTSYVTHHKTGSFENVQTFACSQAKWLSVSNVLLLTLRKRLKVSFSPGFVDDQKSEALDRALDEHSFAKIGKSCWSYCFLEGQLTTQKQIMKKFLKNLDFRLKGSDLCL